MGKTTNEERSGCFAWMIRTKKAFNERWARARNAIRRVFARENGTDIKPEDLINDTGCPDLIISKTPIEEPKPTLQTKLEVDAITRMSRTQNDNNGEIEDDTEKSVEMFVKNIIDNAVSQLKQESDRASMTSSVISEFATKIANQSLTNILVQAKYEREGIKIKYDTDSLSSAAVSDIAEAIVSDSIAKILDETNNASINTSPRTVSELLERLSIDPMIGLIAPGEHGISPCSI